MKFPERVLDSIDFARAVEEELNARNRFLPPSAVDYVLRHNADELVSLLETQMRHGFEPSPHDVVLARKAGRGSRPLPYLALTDRLAYRALVNVIIDLLPAGWVARGDYEAFEAFPMQVAGCTHVLKADVAAYYQYVDHEQLVDEVIAQTGDEAAISAVVELIRGGIRRRYGLPQMSDASDILGDLYIEPMRRTMLRRGYQVVRYADDFRIACRSYDEVLRAQEDLERAALEIGLVLHETKTASLRIDTYSQRLNDVAAAEAELAAAVDEGPTLANFFTQPTSIYEEDADDWDVESPALVRWPAGVEADEEEPTETIAADPLDPSASVDDVTTPDLPGPREIQGAVRVLAHHLDLILSRDDFNWSDGVWSVMVRKALAVLQRAENAEALPYVTHLLVTEPHLTPQVSSYLSAIARRRPQQVAENLDAVLDSEVSSSWQTLWLAHVAGTLPASADAHAPSAQTGWLQGKALDAHPSVRAQAVLSLAQRGDLDPALAAKVHDEAPEVHRLTTALALLGAQLAAEADATPADVIERYLELWVARQPWGEAPWRRAAAAHDGAGDQASESP